MSTNSTKIGIIYSKNFDEFLSSLNDPARVVLIKKEIEDFADGFVNLDPRDCEHFKDREKIGINSASVVVYYDIDGNDWVMIGGMVWHTRVA